MTSKANCSAHKSGLGAHRMKLSHVDGPCSPFANSGRVSSTPEILVKNEARVKWLNSRISNSNPRYTTMAESEAKSIETVGTIGDGKQYYITISLGTPKVDYKVMIDTGSDSSWVLCKGCIEGCDSTIPLFDPSKSSSYRNDSESFNQKYGDNSEVTGYWSFDKLTLENDVINTFKFGCAVSNRDENSNKLSGLLGLGSGSDSFVSQSASKNGKVFGYCLSKPNNNNGYLYFGDEAKKMASSSPLKFTQLTTRRSYYYLQLVGISVEGNRLNVSPTVFTSKETIIDSGTVVTHLPGEAYKALSSAFKQSMSAYQPVLPPAKEKVLDTCFSVQSGQSIKIPSVTFHFAGETDVDLDQSGIGLFYEEEKKWCLGFTAKEIGDQLTIIGNTQQREMVVLYDIDGGRIGFGQTGCA